MSHQKGAVRADQRRQLDAMIGTLDGENPREIYHQISTEVAQALQAVSAGLSDGSEDQLRSQVEARFGSIQQRIVNRPGFSGGRFV